MASRDLTPADRAVMFINNLTHTSGKFSGHRFDLRPWQEHDIIRPFFGTINPQTGLRQYRTLYLELPRKNGKSELIAAVTLYCLFGDGEYGGQVYGAAADKAQAGLIFDVAAQMVLNDPYLRGLVSISHRDKNMAF